MDTALATSAINLPIEEVVDPAGICRDVRGIGRHGTGDTQFTIGSIEDIPLGIDLIRQSLQHLLAASGG